LNEGKTIKRIGESCYEIFYLKESLEKGKYTWDIKIDHHPGRLGNIITGVMTNA